MKITDIQPGARLWYSSGSHAGRNVAEVKAGNPWSPPSAAFIVTGFTDKPISRWATRQQVVGHYDGSTGRITTAARNLLGDYDELKAVYDVARAKRLGVKAERQAVTADRRAETDRAAAYIAEVAGAYGTTGTAYGLRDENGDRHADDFTVTFTRVDLVMIVDALRRAAA